VSHGAAMTRSRATDATLRGGERARVKADFARARDAYLKAVAHVCELHDDVAQAKANMQQAKDNQKGIEAGWGAPGGKNKEERDANLALARQEDEDWMRLQDEIAECQSAIADAEPKIERDEYDIRVARLDMEMAIAEMRVLAGLDEYRHER
jgi:formate dehydrogenase maturation protein FdhE